MNWILIRSVINYQSIISISLSSYDASSVTLSYGKYTEYLPVITLLYEDIIPSYHCSCSFSLTNFIFPRFPIISGWAFGIHSTILSLTHMCFGSLLFEECSELSIACFLEAESYRKLLMQSGGPRWQVLFGIDFANCYDCLLAAAVLLASSVLDLYDKVTHFLAAICFKQASLSILYYYHR